MESACPVAGADVNGCGDGFQDNGPVFDEFAFPG
jgi:hypothetical protein